MKIVIPTCDKYSYLVPGNIHSIRKSWPDCPYEIVVITGREELPIKTAEVVYLGDDRQYGTNLLTFLDNNYSDKELLIWLDDYYLFNVNINMVTAAHKLVASGSIDGVRLSKMYTPQEEPKYKKDERFVYINKQEQYSFSQQAAIWNTDVFHRILYDGEDPWQTELNGSGRISHGVVNVGDLLGVSVESLQYHNLSYQRTIDTQSIIWYMRSVARDLNV